MPQSEQSDFSEFELENKQNGFDFNSFLAKNALPLSLLLVGLILAGMGVFISRVGLSGNDDEIEIINAASENTISKSEIIVEIAGAVEKPGVYKLDSGSRISDLMINGGGLSAEADRAWVDKYLNKAAVLVDGQKVYIPNINEQTIEGSANISSSNSGGSGIVAGASNNPSGLVNINTATLSELDTLPGIGPVYGQNIIEQRPYSSVEELVTKKVLRKDIYEKIKDKVSVY